MGFSARWAEDRSRDAVASCLALRADLQHLEVKQKNPQTTKMLLDTGTHVNARNRIGQISLHLAAEHGYKGIVLQRELLLASRAGLSGIDLNQVD